MWVVWTGAAAGVAVRMLWLRAPSWAALGPYLLVGWTALLVLPQLLERAGATNFTLILTGGVAYTAGAVIYARRRPDPRPEFSATTSSSTCSRSSPAWPSTSSTRSRSTALGQPLATACGTGLRRPAPRAGQEGR